MKNKKHLKIEYFFLLGILGAEDEDRKKEKYYVSGMVIFQASDIVS